MECLYVYISLGVGVIHFGLQTLSLFSSSAYFTLLSLKLADCSYTASVFQKFLSNRFVYLLVLEHLTLCRRMVSWLHERMRACPSTCLTSSHQTDQAIWAIPLPYQHPKPSHCTVISSSARNQLLTVRSVQLLPTDTVPTFCMLSSRRYLLDFIFINRLCNLKIWKTRKQWCPVKPINFITPTKLITGEK